MDELVELLKPRTYQFSQKRLKRIWKEYFRSKPFPCVCGYLLSDKNFIKVSARFRQEDPYSDIWEYGQKLKADETGAFISHIRGRDGSYVGLIIVGNPTSEEISLVSQYRMSKGLPQKTIRQLRSDLIEYRLFHELRHIYRNDRAKCNWYKKYKILEEKRSTIPIQGETSKNLHHP
jgi:hypothetical protein